MVNNLFQRFFSIHIPANNKYVGLDFYLSFFFLLSNSYLFLVSSMQIAETVDFLFTAKVPLSKYLDSRSLNKNIFWWPWTENT